ncbi:MAG TPA: TonB family protein [Planctomycetota bacterium]|nr:TonB family protein [Planctomycetota bacterium]
MAAVTVPPPGWVPIGARELLFQARRNFSRGLLLSGLAHFTLLGAALWLHQRAPEAEPRLYRSPAILVTDIWDPPPIDRPAPPTSGALPDRAAGEGEFVPTEEDIVRLPDPGTTGVPRTSGRVGERPVGNGEETTAPPGEPRLPGPNEFVFHEQPPIPVVRPDPKYPEWAREAGIEGRVVLHVLVDRDGSVVQVRVIQAVNGLTDAAREALLRWTFRPATSGGRPVAVWVVVPVVFRLP